MNSLFLSKHQSNYQIDYQANYLKYKNKYLALKAQIGGIDFKIDDKVYITGTNNAGRSYKNEKATLEMIDNNIYKVRFNNLNLGIDEVSKNMLRLPKRLTDMYKKFKVDDRVYVTDRNGIFIFRYILLKKYLN